MSTVKDVKYVRSAACLTIVDKVFACREAFHSRGYVFRRSSRAGVFAEEPETIRDAVEQAVGNV
ncbi:MAG TPA: hypothetical protein VNW97_03100 [Candidatus Saccharimonadales bacterium]|nr:hypothetical protein [Candidatus Saccharimonadales bacterium]